MSSLKFLSKLDKLLCQLLGIASPWLAAPLQHSGAYTAYAYLLYVTPGVMSCLIITMMGQFKSYIIADFLKLNIVLYTIEIYANIYFYSSAVRNSNTFTQSPGKNEERLISIFKAINIEGFKVNFSKSFVIALMNANVLVIRTFSLNFVNFPYIFINVFRQLIVLTLSLQWSLCMQYLGSRLSECRKLLKTSLAGHSPNSASDNGVKSINLNTLQTAIGVYRSVADDNAIINDYYNIHLLFNVTIITTRLLRYPYMIWYRFTRPDIFSEGIWNFIYFLLFITMTLCDVFIIATKALISECISRKVSQRSNVYNINDLYMISLLQQTYMCVCIHMTCVL